MDLSQFKAKDNKPYKTALKKSYKYIYARMNGLNKQESRAVAGYKNTNTNIPETTKAYSVALNHILELSNGVTRRILISLERDAESGALDALNPDTRAGIAKKMAEIQKILTPTLTIKEEKDKDGNTKITRWGTSGVSTTSQDANSEEIEE